MWAPLYTSVKMSDLGFYIPYLYAGSICSIYLFLYEHIHIVLYFYNSNSVQKHAEHPK